MTSPQRLLAAALLLPALALGACSDDAEPGSPASSPAATPSGSASASASPSATSSPVATTASAFGVKVSGAFGKKPTLTVPKDDEPTKLGVKVLSQGKGQKIAGGDGLVVQYLGQTWKPKDGKANVFDNSFDKGFPFGFPVGQGKVIQGWDQGLVGIPVGSRVLLTIPPALAYGEAADPQNPLAGQTLLFVVDLVDVMGKNLVANGTAVTTPLPAGMPQIDSQPGKQPSVRSVTGVKVDALPKSFVLIEGNGPKIDPDKGLALHMIEVDATTGNLNQQTWGSAPQIVPAQQVLAVADKLKDKSIGSRVVVVAPSQSAQNPNGGVILLLDVVAQY